MKTSSKLLIIVLAVALAFVIGAVVMSRVIFTSERFRTDVAVARTAVARIA